MAKITNRQKNNILAKWKTGAYTQRQIAKTYKVDVATINKIVKGIPKENSDLVEAGVLFENAKKSTKSQQEIKEINNAIEYRLKNEFAEDKKRVRIYDTSFEILETINGILKKGTIQEKINVGPGLQNFEDRSINADDTFKMANAVEKISQTVGVNSTKSSVEVNNTNAVQNNTTEEITISIKE